MFNNLGASLNWIGAIFSSIFGGAAAEMGDMSDTMEAIVDFLIKLFTGLGDIIAGVLGFIASPIEKKQRATR